MLRTCATSQAHSPHRSISNQLRLTIEMPDDSWADSENVLPEPRVHVSHAGNLESELFGSDIHPDVRHRPPLPGPPRFSP
jgi:hypothetical protein